MEVDGITEFKREPVAEPLSTTAVTENNENAVENQSTEKNVNQTTTAEIDIEGELKIDKTGKLIIENISFMSNTLTFFTSINPLICNSENDDGFIKQFNLGFKN